MTNKLERGELISYATKHEDWELDIVERMLFKCARKLNAEYRHASFFDNPSAYMQQGDIERREAEEMLHEQSQPAKDQS